jgi:preprotein translocase subunit Sec63
MLKKIILLALFVIIINSETLYEILELSSQANTLDIKKAFRRLSIKYTFNNYI